MNTLELKTCPKCKVEKAKHEFYLCKSGLDGYCKSCRRTMASMDRRKNPDRIKAELRRWYLSHRDEHRKNVQNWKSSNKARVERHRRFVYWSNPEKNRKATRDWTKTNPERVRANNFNTKARRRGAQVGDQKSVAAFVASVKQAPSATCYYCNKNVPKRQRHIDHIIPIIRGGKHSVENLCCSCAKCNLSKNRKTPEERFGQAVLL